MAVYSKPVSRAFVLRSDKAEEFLAQKADPKIMEMHRKRAELIIKDYEKRTTK